jgi:hypothetical protein
VLFYRRGRFFRADLWEKSDFGGGRKESFLIFAASTEVSYHDTYLLKPHSAHTSYRVFTSNPPQQPHSKKVFTLVSPKLIQEKIYKKFSLKVFKHSLVNLVQGKFYTKKSLKGYNEGEYHHG